MAATLDMVDHAAFWARRRANDDLEAMAKRSTCAECGAGFYTPLVDGEIVPRCSKNPAHRGMAVPPTVMQAYRRGDDLPLEIMNAIEGYLERHGKPLRKKEAR